MIDKKIIKEAKELALAEIKKYNASEKFFEIANTKGQKLAKKLGADKNIVMLGTLFMDLKVSECVAEGKVPEHIQRSADSAKIVLDKYKSANQLTQEEYDKILNCIEAHHATKPYACKESEICANADCYKFLHPRGFINYAMILGERDKDADKVLDALEAKMDEKIKIVSLDICKKELERNYKKFKKIIAQARKG